MVRSRILRLGAPVKVLLLLFVIGAALATLAGPALAQVTPTPTAPAPAEPEMAPEPPPTEAPPAETPPTEEPGEAPPADPAETVKTPAELAAEAAAAKAEAARNGKAPGKFAPEPVVNPDEWLELTLPESVDIRVFIDYVGQKLRMNFIYDDSIIQVGPITLKPNQRVRVGDLYRLLEDVLSVKNLSMVRMGNWVLVIQSTRAGAFAQILKPGQMPSVIPGESVVTEMLQLAFADPTDIQDALTPFLSDNGTLVPFPDKGLLTITEYKSRMEVLRPLIKLLDVRPTKNKIVVLDLKYVKAPDLQAKLQTAMAMQSQPRFKMLYVRTPTGPGGGRTLTATRQAQPAEPQPLIDVDERQNRLVVMGTDEAVAQIKELVEIYDVPARDLQSVKFYDLTYISAEDAWRGIAEIGLLGTEAVATGQRRVQQQRIPGQQQMQQPMQVGVAGAVAGTGAAAKVTVLQSTNTLVVRATLEEHEKIASFLRSADVDRPTQQAIRIYMLERRDPVDLAEILKAALKSDTIDPRTKTPVPGAEGAPTIVAVQETNSLLVNATPTQHQQIREIIRELDSRQPQVLLECTLVEVTDNKQLDIGLELEGNFLGSQPGDRTLATTQFGFSQRDPTTGLRLLNAAATGPSATVAFLNDDIVLGLLRVFQEKNNARVLSKPRVLVNDNEKGVIKSLDQEPVTSLDALTANTTTVSFKQYVEAGTTLAITPHISEGDFLKLEIDALIETFTAASTSSQVPPPKSTREVNSIITVPDQKTIVIGGLTGKRHLKTITQVPFIGDIPIFGELFRHTVSLDTNVTIYLFVKASILRDVKFGDLAEETQKARDVMPGDLQALDPTLTTEAAKKEAERLNALIRRRAVERTLEGGREQRSPITETPADETLEEVKRPLPPSVPTTPPGVPRAEMPPTPPGVTLTPGQFYQPVPVPPPTQVDVIMPATTVEPATPVVPVAPATPTVPGPEVVPATPTSSIAPAAQSPAAPRRSAIPAAGAENPTFQYEPAPARTDGQQPAADANQFRPAPIIVPVGR